MASLHENHSFFFLTFTVPHALAMSINLASLVEKDGEQVQSFLSSAVQIPDSQQK
jgi:hypothetical protein